MSSKAVVGAPDNEDEWPAHFMKRDLIELKKTIDVLELWPWFGEVSPPDSEGYMFWNHENMNKISAKLDELYGNPHSGASWGIAMRNIQMIAREGFDVWKNAVESNQ